MTDTPQCRFILPGETLPPAGGETVGGKAWSLMRMVNAGLRVPPGFVLGTDWYRALHAGTRDADSLRRALAGGISRLEAATGLGFGSARRPLLVSVRSGAAVSMPGMLETVLDVGLTPHAVEGLLRLTGNPRLAWDSYRRLVQGYAEVVAGLPTAPFDALLQQALAAEREDSAQQLDHRALRRLTLAMLAQYGVLANHEFPAHPLDQLCAAAGAVFSSWDAPKAASYRRLNGLDDAAGTAVTVQTMVFGNAGGASGAGVGFTRDPASSPAASRSPTATGCAASCRTCRRGWRPVVACWRRCSATRRTSNSRCRMASCSCCRPAPPNVPPGRACVSRSIWWRKV